MNELRIHHVKPNDKTAIMHHRTEVIRYLDEVIGECDWVVGKHEHLDFLSKGDDEPGNFIASLLDLTNYDHEKLVIKAFEILYRLFNATHTLFAESQRVQLIKCEESRTFSHYLDEHLPIIRRLGGGMVEKGEDAKFVLPFCLNRLILCGF